MQTIEERVAHIEERNKRVELDKKWETSPARIISISIITYIFGTLAFVVLDNPKPLLNACIPVLGFMLSTLSLPFIKKVWSSYFT